MNPDIKWCTCNFLGYSVLPLLGNYTIAPFTQGFIFGLKSTGFQILIWIEINPNSNLPIERELVNPNTNPDWTHSHEINRIKCKPGFKPVTLLTHNHSLILHDYLQLEIPRTFREYIQFYRLTAPRIFLVMAMVQATISKLFNPLWYILSGGILQFLLFRLYLLF